MLRTFIFNESKSQWIEEQNPLLSHDICAILDEENELIFLWSGSKINKTKFRKGYNQIKELISSFPDLNIQVIMAKKNFPVEIQNRFKKILESSKLERGKMLKFSRFTTIRIYSITIIAAIVLPFLSFLNLSMALFWSSTNENYHVTNVIYDNWLNLSNVFNIIVLILFSLNIIIGIIENEGQVIIFSLIGVILSIGLILYLNQGIYLFLFQEGSTLTNYFISKNDLLIFLLLNFSAILIIEIPNIYKLISFFKTYRKFIF